MYENSFSHLSLGHQHQWKRTFHSKIWKRNKLLITLRNCCIPDECFPVFSTLTTTFVFTHNNLDFAWNMCTYNWPLDSIVVWTQNGLNKHIRLLSREMHVSDLRDLYYSCVKVTRGFYLHHGFYFRREGNSMSFPRLQHLYDVVLVTREDMFLFSVSDMDCITSNKERKCQFFSLSLNSILQWLVSTETREEATYI